MSRFPQSPLILITGASQGIGAEIARQFASLETPLRLALLARSEEGLAAVKQQCSGADEVELYPCDASDETAVASTMAAIAERQGPVGVLINNAGQWHCEPVAEMAPSTFSRIVASNLHSTYLLCHHVVPMMQNRGQGDIFNMVSTAGFEGYPGISAYCAAKHGVMGFSRALREELRGDDIRVCCVSPGATDSPSWQGVQGVADKLMPAEDVARVFVQMYQMDRRVVTEELILRPRVGHVVS